MVAKLNSHNCRLQSHFSPLKANYYNITLLPTVFWTNNCFENYFLFAISVHAAIGIEVDIIKKEILVYFSFSKLCYYVNAALGRDCCGNNSLRMRLTELQHSRCECWVLKFMRSFIMESNQIFIRRAKYKNHQIVWSSNLRCQSFLERTTKEVFSISSSDCICTFW